MKIVLALALGAGLLAGCGSSKPSDAPLKSAVHAYSDAFTAGKGDAAYTLLSVRCQRVYSKQQMEALSSAAASLYGSLPIKTLTVDSLSSSDATVSYTYAVSKIDQTHQHWVREGGWKYDGC